ncbi:hypothetical protein NSQ62_12265 [Solibacillus sp. FSL H8-0523]|uniref:hypothetical protein n=1 Tax=Solibacillus sp. FSL H8-0523 TaxID=2954511 RepID=UPI00310199F5
MPILESLRQVESEMFDDHHPLALEPLAMREAYAIGYTMLACVNGYPSEIVKKQLKREIIALGLPSKFRKTAIEIAINADPDVIYQILAMIVEPRYKYIFMLDLYEYAFQDQKVTEQEQEFLLLFERLLQLSAEDLHFVRGFRLAMLKKDAELASKVVQEAVSCGLTIPFQELHYFLKSFEYWKHEAPKETEVAPTYRSKVR